MSVRFAPASFFSTEELLSLLDRRSSSSGDARTAPPLGAPGAAAPPCASGGTGPAPGRFPTSSRERRRRGLLVPDGSCARGGRFVKLGKVMKIRKATCTAGAR
jgi:hypothetical protein